MVGSLMRLASRSQFAAASLMDEMTRMCNSVSNLGIRTKEQDMHRAMLLEQIAKQVILINSAQATQPKITNSSMILPIPTIIV